MRKAAARGHSAKKRKVAPASDEACGVREEHAAFGPGLRGRNARAGHRGDTSRYEAVMEAAERAGLLEDKDSRIAGRVSSALVAQAKRQTGIESDTDLIAFALASIAIEDDFIEVFRAVRGKIDPTLK